jgi:kumamolisin
MRRAAICAAVALACTGGLATTAAAAQSGNDELAVLLELSYSKKLSGFVKSVSDPTSRHYRDYRTVNQLVNRFGPKQKTKHATTRWAARHGLRATIDPSGAFATVTGDAADVRAAFAPAGARAATAGPAVPDGLPGVSAAVFVDDLPDFTEHAAADPSVNQSGAQRTGSPAGCTEGQGASSHPPYLGWTPNQYLTAYGHDALRARGLSGRGVRMAVIEIDGFAQSDVETFAACFGVKVPPINTIPVGMAQPFPPGDETTLDLEVLTAAAPGLESIDVYENANPLLSIAAAISKPKTRPDVISISLGGCENDTSAAMVNARITNALLALAAGSGTSVLVSTGDTGSTSCLNPADPTGKQPVPIIAPSYPATSPYVTAVGGTNIALDEANRLVGQWVWNGSPEEAGSGTGGQSMLFGQPWWQDTPLQTTNRTVPDIAALADNRPGYAIYCTSSECAQIDAAGWMTVGGTSAAAPLMAAGVALANEAAQKRGQPTLGLINPLIYRVAHSTAAAQVLSDVTVGTNDVGTAIQPPLSTGQPIGAYSAAPGYDMASGWGSLNVPRFNDVALGYGRAAAAARRLRGKPVRP